MNQKYSQDEIATIAQHASSEGYTYLSVEGGPGGIHTVKCGDRDIYDPSNIMEFFYLVNADIFKKLHEVDSALASHGVPTGLSAAQGIDYIVGRAARNPTVK